VPGGGELRTLRDAANYTRSLPKRKHDPPGLRAMKALMLVAVHSCAAPCCRASQWCGPLKGS
jgi:hypothetical protein